MTGPLTIPTGLQVLCNPQINKATVSWAPVFGADFYGLRVNSRESAGFACGTAPDDFCIDLQSPITSYTFDIIPGKRYNWWVHAVIDSVWSEPVAGADFICSNLDIPTLNVSLYPEGDNHNQGLYGVLIEFDITGAGTGTDHVRVIWGDYATEVFAIAPGGLQIGHNTIANSLPPGTHEICVEIV